MFIAKTRPIRDFRKSRSPILCLLILTFSTFMHGHSAIAHPVSQGAIDIIVHTDRIELLATVSLEEILVAATFNGNKNNATKEALGEHGEYLLKHFHLRAEGQPVTGHVLEAPRHPTGQLTYRLGYPLVDAPDKQIELSQNVLREFMFAPGNPWEASYIVKFRLEDQASSEGLLLTYREPLTFEVGGHAGLDRMRLMEMFVRHGIVHIITGYDHLLFVGALVLAVTGWRDLIKVIVAFTLAHTLTLALSVLNIIRLPPTFVEPMIAGSIVAVAVENIFWPHRSHGNMRLWLAFGFGLFHGLGFAGGLLDAMAGMAVGNIALAIIAFGIGVEIGHQIVVLPAFLGLMLLRRADAETPHLITWVQCYGSAVVSLFGLAYFYAALR